jgi:hypothetical protein
MTTLLLDVLAGRAASVLLSKHNQLPTHLLSTVIKLRFPPRLVFFTHPSSLPFPLSVAGTSLAGTSGLGTDLVSGLAFLKSSPYDPLPRPRFAYG